MKVLSVVGARPQFIKLAPVHKALVRSGNEHVIIHTGQHYDHSMSEIFFEDLGIPAPDENLSIGSASHARQTGLMLEALETSILRHAPDYVLAYGDTNSTLAAALASVKIHQRLAHLEAGLRSFNRLMPEEHNRVLTDHASDILLAPTEIAYNNLVNEGLGQRSYVVGDVMTDVLLETFKKVQQNPPTMPTEWSIGSVFVVATIHRQENTDDPVRLRQIIEYLASSQMEIRLIVHPRLAAKAQEFGLDLRIGKITPYPALAYPQLLTALSEAVGVVTDSGGLQKEAFLMRTPCITVRTETEWVETVSLGWNVLAPNCDVEISQVFQGFYPPTDSAPFGDGNAASRVVEVLSHNL
jgi:UDP-N-acetylglucosamine 2-epimerase (non-hydrolysing)